jgi:hypothetical protein
LDDLEIRKLQRYLVNLFGNRSIRVKLNRTKEAAEVEIDDEFVGTIYRDEDEGELSYTFTMAILDIDLDESDAG